MAVQAVCPLRSAIIPAGAGLQDFIFEDVEAIFNSTKEITMAYGELDAYTINYERVHEGYDEADDIDFDGPDAYPSTYPPIPDEDLSDILPF